MKKRKYEEGQTLLFVIVAVTIALTVGVAVSTRTISSLRRVSRTDTSTRVIAAAEAGIENMLGRTYSQLNAAMDADEGGCDAIGAELGPETGTCMYILSESSPDDQAGSDVISSRAVVSVEKFSSNLPEGNGYSFDLEPGLVKEIILDGDSEDYTSNQIQLCWKSNRAVIYYYSYDSNGTVKKGGLYPNGFPDTSIFSGLFEPVPGAPSNRTSLGFNYCENISLVSDSSYGLRIKVLYGPDTVAVFPSPETLPAQGYMLTSRGEVATETGSEERATVIVRKSYPYAPDIFDYGIYTPEILE